MAKKQKKSLSVEEQLRLLYDIQLIDSRIHKLEELRGELPLQVKFYEDEIIGLEGRINKIKERIKNLGIEIQFHKEVKSKAEKDIERYRQRQEKARNDREYKSLQEDIDYFEGEIALADKKIKQALTETAQLEQQIAENEELLAAQREQLKSKQAELDEILKETEREEEELKKMKEEYMQQLSERLVRAYKRLVNKYKNRLAVVSYDESYFVIPPQVQVEIRDRDRIIVDEHTGRILVDPELAKEERERMQEIFAKLGEPEL